MRDTLIRIGLVLALGAGLWAQEHNYDASMGNMPMPGAEESASQAQAAANEEMSHHHLDMGPHMKMTAPRPATQVDKDRAAITVATTREALEKYKDYKAALADGYKIFLPNAPSKMKHLTSNSYAMENAFGF